MMGEITSETCWQLTDLNKLYPVASCWINIVIPAYVWRLEQIVMYLAQIQ